LKQIQSSSLQRTRVVLIDTGHSRGSEVVASAFVERKRGDVVG
jgi:C-terminal processing protease CtpA/Prc